MSSDCYLRIAISSPLRQHFDYLPPRNCDIGSLTAGIRVEVPFGRRQETGILLSISNHTDVPKDKLRHATRVLDDTPMLDGEILSLLQWASQYYQHAIGEVMFSALPVLLRQGATAEARSVTFWQLTDSGIKSDPASLARAPKQVALLQHLQDTERHELTADDFNAQHENWRSPIKRLVEKGLVTTHERRGLLAAETDSDQAPALNDAQQAAINAVCESKPGFTSWLLDGVTGSGKTEVYLGIIEHILASGLQALVLVPEISLTPQTLQRFRKRFSVPLVMLHSGLSQRERLDAWLAAKSGEARIIIGTRSALFTPLAQPGVIIIDEEHDASFKQHEGFRYHARDLAVLRAQRLGIPIVLGSATPSLESLANVEQGRYRELRLNQRINSAELPPIQTIDLRAQPLDEGLSRSLLETIAIHLERNDQVLLFLNRRGYAPTLCCHDCGWIADCPRCDARLTLHAASQRLRCHHCSTDQSLPPHCPECGSTALRALGQGTERIEQALQQDFPDTDILRIDRDTTRRKGAMQAMLDSIHRGGGKILLGTQMLAKGHDFPNVTLVAILDADQGLFGADFRASETMAQLITQVAGRAGRAEKPGHVLVQTYHPEHPLLQSLLQHGYPAFARQAMTERREACMPPYASLAMLRAEAGQKMLPMQFLSAAYQVCKTHLSPGIELLGPVPAPMERRAGRFRAQLLLQADKRGQLQQLLHTCIPLIEALPEARKVRWSIDVDPVNTL